MIRPRFSPARPGVRLATIGRDGSTRACHQRREQASCFPTNGEVRGLIGAGCVRAVQLTGTVMYNFNDIERPRKRWEQFPEEMAIAVARHDELLHGAIEANHGHVFKTIGDACCAAFANPLDSVEATIATRH